MTLREYLELPSQQKAEYDRWFWTNFITVLGGNINMIDHMDPAHARQDDTEFDIEREEMGR